MRRLAWLTIYAGGGSAALAQENGQVAAAPGWFDEAMHGVAWIIEAAGIAIIVLGAAGALLWFLRELLRGADRGAAYNGFRANLGRGILLGLEFLVAADIIGTVAVDPTLENLGVLAIIVVIRTFLSFALEVEIEGHWPWQRTRYARERDQAADPAGRGARDG